MFSPPSRGASKGSRHSVRASNSSQRGGPSRSFGGHRREPCPVLAPGGGMLRGGGGLPGQLSGPGGEAAVSGAGVLGVSYVVRMLGDSISGLGWLRWLTPLGWIEELRPMADPQPIALAPIVGLVLACGGLTILLAGRRDLNASILHESEGKLGDTRLLTGPTSLALRLSRPTARAWLVGIVGFSIMLGSVARSSASVLSSSPAFTAVLGRLGVRAATQVSLS